MARSFLWIKFLLALLLPLGVQAQADRWPSGPIRIFVGYPAGGSTDMAARAVGEHLAAKLGQPVIVENRAGAGGTIAAAAAAKAEPNGLTLLMGGSPELTISKVTRKDLGYDSQRDFAPISLVGTAPFVLVANASVPATDLKSFLAWVKAQNGKASYASYGASTSNHLFTELLKMRVGFDALHVPYKGSGPALIDLMAGEIQFMFDFPASIVPNMGSGKIKALASATKTRWPQLPDVPTMTEAGVPDFVIGSWYGLLAPAGTPKPIVDRLQREVSAMLRQPEVRKTFEQRGVDAGGGSSEEFAQLINNEIANWRLVAAKLNMKPE